MVMTDREFKKQLKKLGIVFALMLVLMASLSVYTLGSTKADLSIYKQTENGDDIKVLGMKEDELKQYLSLFGNLVVGEEQNEKLKLLNMATNFIDTMCSSYEVQTNENGQRCYDAKIVHQIIKETKGEFIKTGLNIENYYTYDKESNLYIQTQALDKIPYCLQIDNITKNGDKTEITYQIANMTDTQRAEYMTGKQTQIQTQTVKITILNNVDYEYSKYFVSNIEN